MKVIGINGSPKEKGNTAFALDLVGEQLKENGIDFEIIQVGSKTVRGCTGCWSCASRKDEKCIIDDKIVEEALQSIKNADGLLLGTPVYFSAINGTLKSFLDRLFVLAGVNGGLFRHKVGASVVAVRRSGGLPAFNELNNYLMYSEMIIPASNYWNVIHGRVPGDAQQDLEGMQIMRTLGKNMAWTLKAIELGKEKIELPEREDKITTSFIR